MTVVVKLGSSLAVQRAVVRARAKEIAALGEPVCVVSSGAIALGLERLGLAQRPRSLPKLQAASALGQARLQTIWDAELSRAGLDAAQVLLTAADIADRGAYVNARNALQALLKLHAVPIVNENDATATDEITFGDNDVLAAQVAILLRARLLVLLTEVEGVYSRAPGRPGARLLDAWTGEAEFGRESTLGRGGMRSKVVAAEMASAAGIETVIASGAGRNVLPALVAGAGGGTRFAARGGSRSAFELWLRFAKPAAARVRVDDGARRALVEDGASLLAVGVVSCEQPFEAGDAVELAALDGAVFAKGLAGVDSGEVQRRARGVEVVHRDRLVVF